MPRETLCGVEKIASAVGHLSSEAKCEPFKAGGFRTLWFIDSYCNFSPTYLLANPLVSDGTKLGHLCPTCHPSASVPWAVYFLSGYYLCCGRHRWFRSLGGYMTHLEISFKLRTIHYVSARLPRRPPHPVILWLAFLSCKRTLYGFTQNGLINGSIMVMSL